MLKKQHVWVHDRTNKGTYKPNTHPLEKFELNEDPKLKGKACKICGQKETNHYAGGEDHSHCIIECENCGMPWRCDVEIPKDRLECSNKRVDIHPESIRPVGLKKK
ncbi:MAG: hypothetical protein KJI72_00145 [Patescibacteria group bacterium]|nr:hypothetical protein [Patescibacteria group bacterium]